eukprot:10789-Eustigmatos_ZCMA.PRE.1
MKRRGCWPWCTARISGVTFPSADSGTAVVLDRVACFMFLYVPVVDVRGHEDMGYCEGENCLKGSGRVDPNEVVASD